MSIDLETFRCFNDRIVDWRRRLHQIPEVGLDLPETVACLEGEIRALGAAPHRIGGGLIVDIGRDGPLFAWRTDMDGLPLPEETGAAYASRHDGRMHACGHDAHMAIALALIAYLAEHPPACRVRVIFQPGEEGHLGALTMIDGGAMEGVTGIAGLHVGCLDPSLLPGQFGMRAGPLMASTDEFTLHFTGKGTHAAFPHAGRDPIVAAAQFVLALQGLVGREIDPTHSVVATVGRISAGTAFNIIPSTAELCGTFRTVAPEDRAYLQRRLPELADGLARALDLKAQLHWGIKIPVLVNHPDVTALAQDTVVGLFGKESLARMDSPTLGSEDMSYYLERAPGAFVFLATSGGGFTFPNHHPRFDIQETLLWRGMAFAAALIRTWAMNRSES